jgi:hypothetical protein
VGAVGVASNFERMVRIADVSVPQFIRYCVDDLKAFYYEARMVQKPGTPSEELHTWFWGETALGQLLPAVGQRLNGSDDPAWKALASGISR